MSAAQEALRAAATATPENGFDPETGRLTVAGVVYKPRHKLSRTQEKAVGKLDAERETPKHKAATMLVAGKYDTEQVVVDGEHEERQVLRPGEAPPTEAEMRASDEAEEILLDTIFHKIALLFFDDVGEPPTVEAVMDEVGSLDAAKAMVWAMADPTKRKTAVTGS